MSDAELYGRVGRLEQGAARLDVAVEALAATTAEHSRILHGAGGDDRGLKTGVALLREGLDGVRATVDEIRDGQIWLRRTVVAALILNTGLVVAALLWRGAFGSGLPDLKDELKKRPAIHWPAPAAMPATWTRRP